MSSEHSISHQELDSIFTYQLGFDLTLKQLELLSEVLGSTTKSRTVADLLFSKMAEVLEQTHNYRFFLQCSDHPCRLDIHEYEFRFLIRGIDLMTTQNVLLAEEYDVLDRLINGFDAPAENKPMFERQAVLCLQYLRRNNDHPEIDSTQLRTDTLRYIVDIGNWYNDPLFVITYLFKLLEVSLNQDFERDVSEQIVVHIGKAINRIDRPTLAQIAKQVQGKTIHEDFNDELTEYQSRLIQSL